MSVDWLAGMLGTTLNYERNLFTPNIKIIQSLNAQIGAGLFKMSSAGGFYYNFALHFISCLNKHHIETTLGLTVNYDYEDYKYSNRPLNEFVHKLPQISLGYRYQKPGGKFIFRTCVGIPYVQCSVGLAF